MRLLRLVLPCLALGCFLSLGCKPASDASTASSEPSSEVHDHEHSHDHDHPTTLKDGHKVLSELHLAVKAAFEKGDPEAAHGELHEVGHLLEEVLPALLKADAQLNAEAKSTLESSLGKLFDAFSKLDDELHGGTKVVFADIDKTIVEGLDEFKGLTQ